MKDSDMTSGDSAGRGFHRGRFALEIALNAAGAHVLVLAALLRENPLFWAPAAHYPGWIVEGVRYGFWPLGLWVAATGILGWKRGIARWKEGRWGQGLAGVVLGTVQIEACLVTLGIIGWNNFNNLLRGLPLHSHG
jgi:hypothetical protein